jgi:hypothetical protein
MGFFRFMVGPWGRALRIGAGFALVVIGMLVVGNIAGGILAAVGLVPLFAGAFNFCLFAPLFGGPLNGKDILEQH